MTSNRIQKLLFSEYSDFEDIILVEGPFAETDRQGKGIRQVQLGLTPSKLILASYFVEPVVVEELGDQWRPRRGQDPDIESFELVSAYPVECVNLSIYRHRRRQTIKARFCNGKVVYYEIGGWQERKMLWSVWCERIKFLSPYESRTSISETSVGSTSSATSSLYIVRSSLSVTQTGKPTLWCHYACTGSSWADPHVYLGPKFYDKGLNSSTLLDGDLSKCSLPSSRPQALVKNKKIRPSKTARTTLSSRPAPQEPLILSTEHEVAAAEAVEAWEARRSSGRGPRVRRRYALSPCPYLLAGMGPWRLTKAVAYSLQTKKNASSVDLREEGEEFRLPLPKGRLLRTVSLESLAVPGVLAGSLSLQLDKQPQQREDLGFWTRCPGDLLLWGPAQYSGQQCHLRATRKHIDPHIFGIREKRKTCKKQNPFKNGHHLSIRQNKTYENSFDLYGGGGDTFPHVHLLSPLEDEGEEGWLLPVSRFSSSSLAHQLTMIHRQLFLQTTTLDLARARSDMSSWRSPSVTALVLFSLRISCVVANQILLEQEVQKRARVIGKLMSAAYKCHRLHNMLSAEAVLRGLHSLPVYRLRRTWAYVRRHHAINYRRFEDLSKRYFDCREPLFQKTYDDAVSVPPFLPPVSLLAAVLLERLPELPPVQSFKFTTDCSESCRQSKTPLHISSSAEDPASVMSVSVPTSVRRFLSALQITAQPSPPSEPQPSACRSQSHLRSVSRDTLLEHLDWFFVPVSDTPSHRVLQDVQYFLESHQAAASRYLIPINPRVRAFLLHSRHLDMRALYRQSLLMEP